MLGEIVGGGEEPHSLKLLLHCTLTETYGGTDTPLMAPVGPQTCCTPVTGRTRWLWGILEGPLHDFLSASQACRQVFILRFVGSRTSAGECSLSLPLQRPTSPSI